MIPRFRFFPSRYLIPLRPCGGVSEEVIRLRVRIAARVRVPIRGGVRKESRKRRSGVSCELAVRSALSRQQCKGCGEKNTRALPSRSIFCFSYEAHQSQVWRKDTMRAEPREPLLSKG